MKRYSLIAVTLAGFLAIASARAVVMYDSNGFESYAAGNILGQDGWQDGGGIGLPSSWAQKPAVVANGPTGGKVLEFDNIDKTFSSVQRPFADISGTYRYGVASFDYYRDDSTLYNNTDWWPMGANPWGGLAWDHAATLPGLIQPHGGGNGEIAYQPNAWVHIVIVHDIPNGKGSAWVNGVLVSDNANIGGAGGQYNGWYFNDWQTVDQNRTPGQIGRKSYVDNLRVVAENQLTTVPEPGSLALLAGGLLPLLGLRRRK